MIVLKPITTAQSFPLTFRGAGVETALTLDFKNRVLTDTGTFEAKQCLQNQLSEASSIVLRKEGTNEQNVFPIDNIIFAPNNQVITATFTGLQEGDFYQVTILGHNGVICLERAFVTAQNPSEYTPNNNEYIIYE